VQPVFLKQTLIIFAPQRRKILEAMPADQTPQFHRNP
jgi:hypothetical protein